MQDVAVEDLKSLVASQDVDEMRGMLHQVDVHPGDGLYVPSGVLHAPGEGVFLVELQEPEGLSILLEWSTSSWTANVMTSTARI
jgi:mannose-6-phosphate isomerase